MGAHFLSPLVGYEDLVAAEEAVFDPDSVGAVVGSMDHCMSHPDSIGLAGAVDGLGLAEPVSNIRSYLDNHHVVAHSPIRPDRSGHCPIVHCHPGHSHNHNAAGRTAGHGDYRSPVVGVAFAVAFLGRSVVVVVVVVAGSCRIAAGMPFRWFCGG